MPIKDREMFFQSQWTLDNFSDLLGGRRGFSDIDAVTERHKKFLFLEFKDTSISRVPMGQHLLLKNLSTIGDGDVTCIVVFGKPDQPEYAQIYSRGECGKRIPMTTEALYELIRRWDAWAEANKE